MAYLAALIVAVFLGGIVSGFAGFAFSAVAGAILLHFLKPMQAIPLMMLCSIVAQLISLAMVRKHIVWKESTPLLIGGFLGVPIALFLLTLMEPKAFRIAFGSGPGGLFALHAGPAGGHHRSSWKRGHEFRRWDSRAGWSEGSPPCRARFP